MAARRRGTVDLSAAIGAEVAEHQDQAGTAAAPVVAEAPRPAPAPAPEEPAAAVPEPETEAQDQARPETWDARMSMTLSKEMKRALDLARADDGIEGTARLRAMIRLWQQDERHRRRVDRLAKSLR
jgi:hypothetical protein